MASTTQISCPSTTSSPTATETESKAPGIGETNASANGGGGGGFMCVASCEKRGGLACRENKVPNAESCHFRGRLSTTCTAIGRVTAAAGSAAAGLPNCTSINASGPIPEDTTRMTRDHLVEASLVSPVSSHPSIRTSPSPKPTRGGDGTRTITSDPISPSISMRYRLLDGCVASLGLPTVAACMSAAVCSTAVQANKSHRSSSVRT
mmetsp:Transcript_16531/g.37019  ORF Transcript_16531/g.37019 Transcript_16531/m.37019 type:complete len:207 (-) Transcript_16531:972-1592(-)